MQKIDKILDESSVDWGLHEPSGLHLVSAYDFSPKLLTDISSQTAIPMAGIDYGSFFLIVSKDEIDQTIELMKKFGFKSESEPIIDNSKVENINSIVKEAAEELNTKKLFAQFGKAMKVLGEQMGIGPLQDVLKKNGINWRMGDDNSSLVFYTKSGEKEQPIARISAESIGSQNEFQDQLLNMVDFAQGSAPGTLKQRQEELQKQQQLVRDISKTVWPSDDSSKVASLMLADDEKS